MKSAFDLPLVQLVLPTLVFGTLAQERAGNQGSYVSPARQWDVSVISFPMKATFQDGGNT